MRHQNAYGYICNMRSRRDFFPVKECEAKTPGAAGGGTPGSGHYQRPKLERN